MGQKVHPTGIRLGIIYRWKGDWYANKTDYRIFLQKDLLIRKYFEAKHKQAAISGVKVRRVTSAPHVLVETARPGLIIGKKGEGVESIVADLRKLVGSNVTLQIQEVRKPELDASLVAEGIAQQLERRIMFRRAMKRAVSSAMRLGAQGVKVCVSGRLGGAEIARREWYREGRVPLHTFRADIDYGTAVSQTTYGVIGVKVWIFKGEVLKHADKSGEKV